MIVLSKDHTQREIAKLTGLHQTTVLEVQQKYHLVLSFGRGYGRHIDRRYRPWRTVLTALYTDYGMTVDEIAELTHVGPETVRKKLIKFGIVPRKGQNAKVRKTRQMVM